MEGQEHFLQAISRLMPFKVLSEKLKEALDFYEIDQNEETISRLHFSITLLMLKIDDQIPERLEEMKQQIEAGRQLEQMRKDLLGDSEKDEK